MAPIERARWHEAGHVLVGAALRLECGRVVVYSGDHAVTHIWEPSDRELSDMDAAAWASYQESVGIADLAGEAMLDVCLDPNPGAGASRDRVSARKAAEALSPSCPAAALNRMYGRAYQLAEEHRKAAERFVEALRANRDRLAGHDLAVSVRAAIEAWATPRFDAAGRYEFMLARREAFEKALFARHLEDAPWQERFALRHQVEWAVRSGRPI